MKPFYNDNDFLRLGGQATQSNEEEKHYRTDFWRDRARVMHSPAFRRLRGKTQLFPNNNNDFFRCRLTHSLEVANIGKTITRRLNWLLKKDYGDAILKDHNSIDTDLVELACLAHDLGHPPFGHQGEKVLHERMIDHGGFEGNAQTLRILAKIEKKVLGRGENVSPISGYSGINDSGQDLRFGLNLTLRSLASIIKYDSEIPFRTSRNVTKGYYYHEKNIVDKIHEKLDFENGNLSTIECQIMDVADDIAYCTYDLEDAFKGGFLNPMKLLSFGDKFMNKVVFETNDSHVMKSRSLECNKKNVINTISNYMTIPDIQMKIAGIKDDKLKKTITHEVTPFLYKYSEEFAQIGYLRTKFATQVISTFISQISIKYDEEKPHHSRLKIGDDTVMQIEILKKVTYLSQIESSRLKVVEHRGQKVVENLFEILTSKKNENGEFLIPDIKETFLRINDDSYRKRIICDFIASMTNRYAVDYLDRLTSLHSSKSIFSYG